MLSRFVNRTLGNERLINFLQQYRFVHSAQTTGIQINAQTDRDASGGSSLRNFAKKHNFGSPRIESNNQQAKKPQTQQKPKKEVIKTPSAVKLPVVDPKLEAIRSRLRSAQAANRPYDIEAVMRDVRTESANLNAVELGAGFEGCITVGNIEMSTWVLDHMRHLRYIIPGDYIGRIVMKATNPEQLQDLVKLVQELADSQVVNKQGKEDYLNQLISKVAAASAKNPKAYATLMQSCYNIYLDLRNNKKMNVKLTKDTFCSLATYYVTNHNADKCLEIFQDMNRANVEPDIRLCERVLDASIMNMETKVMRVIATWYLEVFNVPLEIGLAQRILEAAMIKSDGQLAIIAFQLLTKTSITPDRYDYYNLVRALIRSNDIVSAVEALQDMETRGVSLIPAHSEVKANIAPTSRFSPGKTNAFDLYEFMKEELQDIFVQTNSQQKREKSLKTKEKTAKAKQQKQEAAAAVTTASSTAAPATEVSNAAVVAEEESDDEDDDSESLAATAAAADEEGAEVISQEDAEKAEEVADSKRRYELLEDFYYALIDQVQKGQPVPRVVVDSILEAMGSFTVYGERNRSSHLGRVRSIFNQYPTVFKLNHDITSYIALIKASKRHANYTEMLTIFQQMEQYIQDQQLKSNPQQQFFVKEGLTVAYSKLYHFMVTRHILRGFTDIWQHMQTEHDVVPDIACLTRMAKYFSISGNVKERDLVLLALNDAYQQTLHVSKNTYGNKRFPYVPRFLMTRLDAMLQKAEAEADKTNKSRATDGSENNSASSNDQKRYGHNSNYNNNNNKGNYQNLNKGKGQSQTQQSPRQTKDNSSR